MLMTQPSYDTDSMLQLMEFQAEEQQKQIKYAT